MGTNMKKLLVVLLALAMCISLLPAAALAEGGADTGDIPIDAEHFPDANFLNYVKTNFDTDSNSSLSATEIEAAKKIEVQRTGPGGQSKPIIDSLKGIEYFTSLETLSCGNNNLTNLDLADNTALKNLSCAGNRLASLDLSKNTALVEFYCENMSYKAPENKLKVLILGNNTALKTLKCGYNELTKLDVSKCSALETLECGSNMLTELNLGDINSLKTLNCGYNSLRSLDVSKCSSLQKLSCTNNHLTSLKITSESLGEFYAYGNSYQAGSESVALASLPGFDVTKIVKEEEYKCEGGTISDDGVLTITSGIAAYTYNCGSGKTAEFKIIAPGNPEIKTYINSISETGEACLVKHKDVGAGGTVLFELHSNVPKHLGEYIDESEGEEEESVGYVLSFRDSFNKNKDDDDKEMILESNSVSVTVNEKPLDASLYSKEDYSEEDLSVDMDLVAIYKAGEDGSKKYFEETDLENKPAIVVTYSAKLDDNEICGSYMTDAYVLYQNSAAASGHDYAYVHTYAIEVFNCDQNNMALTGAKFALYYDGNCVGTGESDDGGMTVFGGLLPGVYWLRQTSAPGEYNINNKSLRIKVEGTESLNKNDHIVRVEFENSNEAPKEDEPAAPSYPFFGGTPSSPTYTVTLPSNPTGGSITSDKSRASEGDTVTITASPKEGYETDKITVTDNDGNPIDIKDLENNKYSFKMPKGGVKIEASFGLIDTRCDGGENCPSRHLRDVDKTEWCHEAIDYVVVKGLMKGTSATTFEPNTPTSRAMIVTILYRLEGNPEVAEGTSFKDVESGAWYTDAIKWAAANKIVNGYGNDMFGPNDPITREQMAAILYRYSQYKGYNIEASASLSKYTDSDKIDTYALAPMNWAVAKGLIQGISETRIDPLGNAVRSQVAVILMRFCEGVAK